MIDISFLPASGPGLGSAWLPLYVSGRRNVLWLLRGVSELLWFGACVAASFCCIYALYLAISRLLPAGSPARVMLDDASKVWLPAATLYGGWALKNLVM